MKTEKLGQSPAFPTIEQSGNGSWDTAPGMTQRLYLAGMAMQGIISSYNSTTSAEYICTKAFEFADELLLQENK